VGEFYRFIRFDMGDGSKIKFFHEVWCRDQDFEGRFLGVVLYISFQGGFGGEITCSSLVTL
jgi:hypothetical protein